MPEPTAEELLQKILEALTDLPEILRVQKEILATLQSPNT